MERSTSGIPLSFQSRAKTRSGPMRRIATGSISPAAWASMTAKLSQWRRPERIKRSNCPLASKRSNRPKGGDDPVGAPFCPRARYARSVGSDRNRPACCEKTWLLVSSTVETMALGSKQHRNDNWPNKLHYILESKAPLSPAKPLQYLIVLKEIGADCRRWA